jgi:hypothetical protein
LTILGHPKAIDRDRKFFVQPPYRRAADKFVRGDCRSMLSSSFAEMSASAPTGLRTMWTATEKQAAPVDLFDRSARWSSIRLSAGRLSFKPSTSIGDSSNVRL